MLLGSRQSILAQEDLSTGTKPAPLELHRSAALPPTLMRWLVPASSRTAGVPGQIAWTPSGQRLFSEVTTGTLCLQCWKPSPAGDALELEGSLFVEDEWAVSPDGRWLFASPKSLALSNPWSVYRADTFEGVWTLRPKKISLNKWGAAFSRDGRWLAIMHEDGADVVFSILDAATGSRVQTVRPPAGSQNRWREGGNFTFGRDALVLAPTFDDQGRITRVPLATWIPEFVSDPVDNTHRRMVLSKDERWLVCWDPSGYEVLERNGLQYTHRFEGEAEVNMDPLSGLQSMKISPDNTQLVISGNGKHKVIRMANQAVVHDAAAECMCGDFSTDGKKFWKSCVPFRAVNTSSWQTLPEAVAGPHGEVHSAAFSPDGKRMAMGSEGGIFVWSLNDLPRPQELNVTPGSGCLTRLTWNEKGTEVWAGDSYRPLRWTLPPGPTGKPLLGQEMFPGLPKPEERIYVQFIEPAAPAGWCLMNGDETGGGEVVVRNPDKPGVVRKLKNISIVDFVTSPRVLSKDRTEFFYTAAGVVTAVNIAHDTVRQGERNVAAMVMGIGGQPERLVLMERHRIRLVDAATLKAVGEIPAPEAVDYAEPAGNWQPAVSPDGRWLFWNLAPTADADDMRPALVDLNARKLQAVLPRLDSNIHVAAFSPDGRMIVAGHQGGAVSLWNVAGLATAGVNLPMTQEQITAASYYRRPDTNAKGPSTPRPKSTNAKRATPSFLWTEEALEPATLSLNNGDTWILTTSGSVKNDASQFDAGRLLINDEPPTPKGMRIMRSPGEGYIVTMETELRAMGDRLRIHRQMRGFKDGGMRWIDAIENLSAEPITLTLALETALGGEARELIDSNRKTPALQAGGALDVAPPVTCVGMVTQKGGVQRGASFCFGSEKPQMYPAIKWNEATRSVRCEWALRLEAFECRMILHKSSERPVNPDNEDFTGRGFFHWSHFSDLNMYSLLPRLLNYAPGERDESAFKATLAKSQVDAEGYRKDYLGFKWRHGHSIATGMSAELGGDRVLEIRIDGAPATFVQQSADKERLSIPGMNCHAASGPVFVRRNKLWHQRDGAVVMHDVVVNPSENPVKCRVELAVVARNRFTDLLAADGRTLDISQPVPVSRCEGKIAILSEGADKPAILVGVGDGSGSAPPATVRWVSGRGVFVTYDLDLNPGQEVPLVHFAAQRPLGAYGTFAEGIAQLDVARMLQTQSGYAPPVNWSRVPGPKAP
ncbi:hypothetical protein AYO49_02660 [Verrucomicrobiaceae bacterium SCGC AG-212-N21]|nr:hypothetical protein AYO49_02660 [Verrucomicrobiaceae bacterium SCGC AG-212-N21]